MKKDVIDVYKTQEPFFVQLPESINKYQCLVTDICSRISEDPNITGDGSSDYFFAVNDFRVSLGTCDVSKEDRVNTEFVLPMWYLYGIISYRYIGIPDYYMLTTIMDISLPTLRRYMQRSDTRAELLRRCKLDTELYLRHRTAVFNSVGSLFMLKACFGYRDDGATTDTPTDTTKSIEDIRSRYLLPESGKSS